MIKCECIRLLNINAMMENAKIASVKISKKEQYEFLKTTMVRSPCFADNMRFERLLLEIRFMKKTTIG